MGFRFFTLISFLAFAGFCCAQGSLTPGTTQGETGFQGVITVTPAHPGPERPGMPSSVPLAGITFSVMSTAGVAAEFTTDEQGMFTVSLPPGHYTVVRKQQQKIGRCGPFDVDVAPRGMKKVEWHCDSGMR